MIQHSLWVLAAVSVSHALELCGTNAGIELCVQLANESQSMVNDCLYTAGYEMDTITHTVSGSFAHGVGTFGNLNEVETNFTCEERVLSFQYVGFVSFTDPALPLSAVAAADISVSVDKDALSWEGTLARGDMASEGNLTASYEVRQSAGTVTTALVVDIPEVEDAELILPSQLTFEVASNFLFEGALAAATCPVTPLTDFPILSVPGIDAGLTIEGASFDPCVLLASSTEKAFLVVGAALDTQYSLHGLTLPDVSVEVSATLAADAEEEVHWRGVVTATVDIFGTSATLVGNFDEMELEAVTVTFDATYGGFSLAGSMTVGENCSTDNTGHVTLSVPSGGFTGGDLVIAQTGCVEGTTTPLWAVTGSVASATVARVTVSDVTVALQSAASGTWSGTLGGTVALGSAANTVSATLTFDGEQGITAFTATGSVAVGAVSGDVSFSVANGVATGTGTLEVAVSNAATPSFTATVATVLDYDENNANLPLWSVQGSLDSWSLFGVDLTGVDVGLEGRLAQGGGVEWSGSVNGTVVIDGTSVSVTSQLTDNALTALVGEITVDGTGASFVGTVEIAPENGAGCTPIDGSGTLTLAAGNHVFDATMLFDGCATTVGSRRYAFTGTYNGDMQLDGLTLSSVSFVLNADVTVESPRALGWSGSLSATANLFGASSSATVEFASGALQTVNVLTSFTTDNQIFSATVEFTYHSGCTPTMGVVRDATLRLNGADDLVFDGSVSYDSCSGVMSIAGSVSGWNGPAATALSGVSVALESSTNGGNPSATLASRTWTGSVTATTGAGLAFDLAFDSTTSASSITGTITYEDTNVKASVALSSDCSGSGTLIVRNLGNNIPSIEAQATFSKDCSGTTNAWTLSGSFAGLSIPFNNKVISLPSVTATLTQDEDGSKRVSVGGVYLSNFFLSIDFTVGASPVDVTLRGGLKAGGAASPDSFSNEFSGKSQFPASLGNAGGMLDAMKNLQLSEVVLEVSFTKKSLSLTASGEVFNVDFSIIVAIQKTASGWSYGMAFSASNFASASGLPSPVKTVLTNLGPDYVQFSVAKEAMTVGDTTLRKGLSLAAGIPINGDAIGDVLAVAPGAFKTQINSAGADGALTLVADIVSATEIQVFVGLAGGISLGGDVTLDEVALAFKISGTASPEMGFLVKMGFSLGSGGNKQDFTAAGFIGLAADGLTIGLSLNSAEPWVRPFGLNGVTVLFPLAFQMTVSPALLPSSLALIGGLEVAGVSGEIVLSADVGDFTKTAFSVQVDNFDLKKIVQGIANCDSCLGGVANTLATASIDQLKGSFNPDPANAVTITIAAASASIPPGINLEIVNMNLWNVIKVVHGQFRVRATGFTATLVAEKVAWGPIEITSADGSTGPSFALVLTTSDQRLSVDGKSTILGKSVTISLAISDSEFRGSFVYSIGNSFNVGVELESTGTPGSGGFSSTLTATMEGNVISAIIQQAIAFLDTLDAAAQKDLDDARADLRDAQSDLQSANNKLAAAEAKATRDLKDARDDVSSLKNKLDDKHDSCKKKEKKCRKKPWTCGSVPKCWTEWAAIKTAKEAAEATLSALIKSTQGAIKTAEAAVDTASDAVTAANAVVTAASDVTSALSDIANAVGGSFDNVLQIQSLTFSAGLTSSSAAVSFSSRLRIVNTNINFGFSVQPTFSAIKNAIENKTRSRLRSVYGSRIPGL